MNKKAFSMIEFIYITIVLGILAGFAIPILSTTRNDAEINKFSKNITTLIHDLNSFYNTNGSFARPDGEFYTLAQITNVELSLTEEMEAFNNQRFNMSRFISSYIEEGNIKIDDKNCISIRLKDKESIEIEIEPKSSRTCKKVLMSQNVKNIMKEYTNSNCMPYSIDRNYHVKINKNCSILNFNKNKVIF